ncbi:marR family protein [Nemania abortiva]|nr:marR family protein [Nemania abortiva]
MASTSICGPEMLVEPIRAVSRQLVRELGFMSSTLAGTRYPPPAVHSLIEIGIGRATTATALCNTLNLEDSSIEHTLRCLIDAGEVKEAPSRQDGGEMLLSLTLRGQQSLAEINTFAQDQVLKALSRINSQAAETVLSGLQIYVASLYAQRVGESSPSKNSHIEIKRGYQPGVIGRALEMHLDFYSQLVGFGAYFESQLATGLADFVSRIDNDQNEVWTARSQGRIVGTIFIDGQDLGQNRAHLRAFIVDSDVRGGGVGRRLLVEAVEFVDKQCFQETRLWTFQGLDAARRLYESFGFVLKEQSTGSQWGKEVTEQLFVRKLPPEKSPRE